MLSPDYLLHVSESAENIAEAIHSDCIRRIVDRITARLGRGDDYVLTSTDVWQINTLQDAGFLLEDIQREIAQKTPLLQREVAEAMEEVGVKALSYDNELYRRVGIFPPLDGMTEAVAADIELRESPYYIRLAQRNYEATMGELANFTRTMPQTAYQLYIRECDRAYQNVMTGSVSYTQAYTEAINTICKEGVSVVYPSGHKDTIETATLRAVRTGAAQASEEISITRQKEIGPPLRITSSHMGARPSHELWQGEIFWVDWSKLNAAYPALAGGPEPEKPTPEMMRKYREFVESTEIGTVGGLAGVNCRHTSSVYYEGMTNPFTNYDSEENKRIYDLTQRQRTLERRIRKTKRETMGLKEATDKATGEAREAIERDYQRKAALLQKQNQAYSEFCTKNDLRPLSDRLQIAQWDRKQAAAARAAARKYLKSKEDK